MSSEVTLRQIAKKSGLSLAAVSMALRNSPKISATNRAAIKALAEEMGYRPNPLVSAGMTKMRAAKGARFQATLAWINDHPESDFWKNTQLFQAARARAAQLGFVMDKLHLPEISIEHPEENVRRFCKIARARGIHGVILPQLERCHHAQEEWPEMAVVVVGEISGLLHHARIKPRRMTACYHTVVKDFFANIRLAFDELRARGYKRIGFTCTDWENILHDNIPHAAAVEMMTLLPSEQRLPPLVTPNLGPDGEKAYAKWIAKTKPDVILTLNNHAGRWLRKLGLTPPEEIGLAHVALGPMEEGWSGVNPREDVIGAAAVDLLSAHLLRNERGIPPYVKRMSIPGIWVDGATTCQGVAK